MYRNHINNQYQYVDLLLWRHW